VVARFGVAHTLTFAPSPPSWRRLRLGGAV